MKLMQTLAFPLVPFVLLTFFAPSISSCSAASADRALFEKVAAELPAAEAEASRLSIPLTPAALKAELAVSPEDNALPILRQASAALKTDSIRATNWQIVVRDRFFEPTDENMRLTVEAFTKMDLALQLAHEAANKPAMSFDRNWSAIDKYGMSYKELSDIKDLVKALSYRARYRSLQGDKAQAVSDIRAAFRLSEFSGADPLLIPAMLRLACDSIVTREVEYILTESELDVELLQSLEAVLTSHRRREVNLLHAYRGEVQFTMRELDIDLKTLANNYAEGDWDDHAALERSSQELLAKLRPAGVSEEIAKQAYRARYLQYWNEVYRPTVKPETLSETAARIEEIFSRYSSATDPTMAVNALLFSPTKEIGDSHVKRNASLDVQRGLIAVLKFKLNNGRFPNSLAEAGFNDLDPFSGKPFHLKVEGEAVRVYSVGPDGLDHGGAERVTAPEGTPRQYDITSMRPRSRLWSR